MGAMPGVMGVSLPLYRRLFDLDPGQGGAMLGALGIGSVASVLVGVFGVGFLTARMALAMIALGALLMGLQASWGLLLLGTLIVGGGYGLASSIFNRRFLAEFGARGPGMLGLLNAIYAIGSIAAPLAFVAAGGSPQLLCLAIALIAAVLIPVVQPSGMAGVPQTGPAIWHRPEALILVLLFATAPLEVALFGFGPSALIARGTPEPVVALLSSVYFTSFLVGRLSLYWLTRWFDSARMFAASVLAIGVCGALAAAGFDRVAYVASGAFVGMVFPTFYVWASDLLGREARTSSAILLAGLAGGAVGPLVLGPILSATGLEALFAVLAVLALVMGAVTVGVLVLLRRPVPAV